MHFVNLRQQGVSRPSKNSHWEIIYNYPKVNLRKTTFKKLPLPSYCVLLESFPQQILILNQDFLLHQQWSELPEMALSPTHVTSPQSLGLFSGGAPIKSWDTSVHIHLHSHLTFITLTHCLPTLPFEIGNTFYLIYQEWKPNVSKG